MERSGPAANRRAHPASQQPGQNAGNRIADRQCRRGTAASEYLPFECGKGRVATHKPGHQQRSHIRMQQIFPVENHRQEANDERARNIDQKSREREPPVVVFIDSQCGQITGQGSNSAAGQDKKASSEQSSDFSARTATLSA
jgi:hypothetical protein